MRISCATHCISALIATAACTISAGSSLRAARSADKEAREQIGAVLGKPVYRDQIRGDEPSADELHRLFAEPVYEKYRREHRKEITPTAAQIDAATAYFDEKHRERMKEREPELRDQLKAIEAQLTRDDLAAEKRQELEAQRLALEIQLKAPGKSFAEFMLKNWKFQRHLYDKFGGGRILWQQAGIEAFDAMRTWFETEEKNGAFKITDSTLRTRFYEYWTTQNHGPFLITDEDRIRKEFLDPEWAKRLPK